VRYLDKPPSNAIDGKFELIVFVLMILRLCIIKLRQIQDG